MHAAHRVHPPTNWAAHIGADVFGIHAEGAELSDKSPPFFIAAARDNDAGVFAREGQASGTSNTGKGNGNQNDKRDSIRIGTGDGSDNFYTTRATSHKGEACQITRQQECRCGDSLGRVVRRQPMMIRPTILFRRGCGEQRPGLAGDHLGLRP
jgi:hypothetical protein